MLLYLITDEGGTDAHTIEQGRRGSHLGTIGSVHERFKSTLADSGYTPLSTVTQMPLMGHLSRWLESNRVCVSDLTAERVEEFLAARWAAGYTGLLSPQAVMPLLDFLSARGELFTAPLPAPKTATDLVLSSFHRYLLQERGLAPVDGGGIRDQDRPFPHGVCRRRGPGQGHRR